MTLPGETLATGAPATCRRCGVTVSLSIQRSPAGYYVGTACDCGPYTRESGYYATAEVAAAAQSAGWFERP